MKTTGILLAFLFLTYSCSKESKKQFQHAGGTISMAIDNEPSTFIPRDVADFYTATVLTQVMEGLVSLDPKDLKIRPQLASDWNISDDGLTYEFVIRDDVYFHPHKVFATKEDRKLSPKDVIHTIELACTKNEKGEAPHAFSFLYKDNLVGAREFFEGASKSISGLSILGSKVIMKFANKDDNFLYKLSNICASITSKKTHSADAEKDMIGTGPFYYSEYKQGSPSKMMLLKNNDYYLKDKDGNALPYLDSLTFIFQNRKLDQLEMFEEHKTDLILGLPTSRITKMLEGRIKDFNGNPPLLLMYQNPLLSTNYYFFNMTDPRFEKLKVRQAFNLAIDKEKLGREVLRNQYYELGYYGMVPPISRIFKGYDFTGVKEASYTYDPEKAKKLLAEAGYPNGKGFGSVNLRFNIDDIHSAVADEFAQQIFQVLNINVNIDGSSFEQKDKDASAANGDIFRSAWAGDYASPETFLSNFYGKNVPADRTQPSRINQSRYVNVLFDQLFEQAKNSNNKAQALDYYAKAEKILMQNPPVIPLWYSGDIQIIYSNVRNLHFNALNMFVFREVYKKAWTPEEYNKAKN
ncbi:MAG: ABC transporter substrate-binding protein [Flavobacteriia bacterium]|jgi:oligopeptide transport system substrate-binding protein